MTVPTVALAETTPAGTSYIRDVDDRIREYKTQNREVMAVDHEYPTTGQSATAGEHKKVTLQDQADLGTGATGKCFLGAQGEEGSAELVFTDEDDNDVAITVGGKLSVASLTTAASIAIIMNHIYPIGIVITLGVATAPATLLGFTSTWVAVEGKVIVGISNEVGDAAFDTLDETGGAQTVTLTSAQSGVPAHTHPFKSLRASGGGAANLAYAATTDSSNSTDSTMASSVSASTAADAASAHTNLQPYIVKYVWQRTA